MQHAGRPWGGWFAAKWRCGGFFRDQHLLARTRFRDAFGGREGVFCFSPQNEFCGKHFGAAEPRPLKIPLDRGRWVGKWEQKKIELQRGSVASGQLRTLQRGAQALQARCSHFQRTLYEIIATSTPYNGRCTFPSGLQRPLS
jgi:hypothetical protein